MKTNQTLTTGEVAKHCGVSFRTVIRWIERGELQAFKLPGRGDNRIRVDVFLNFLRQHEMPVPEELADTQNRVLVVENDPKTARGMRRLLERNGFEVAVAADGFRVGTLLGTFAPTVLIMDVDLEGLSASDVTDFVRSADGPENVRVLVITSPDSADSPAVDVADDVLLRPFEDDDLVERIARLAQRDQFEERIHADVEEEEVVAV